jgi:hypothetical protein
MTAVAGIVAGSGRWSGMVKQELNLARTCRISGLASIDRQHHKIKEW